MPGLRRVALVCDNLMFQSQLAAAVRAGGGELVTVSRERATEIDDGVDAVFVDLNRDVPHRLGAIAMLRARNADRRIVAFCHHGEDETRQAAMRVGASQCITNGGLQAVALRLAGVALPPGSRA